MPNRLTLTMAGGAVVVVSCLGVAGSGFPTDGSAGEQERMEALCRGAQPAVAGISGFAAGDPVPVEVKSRTEVRWYLESQLEVEYPDRELERRSRCFGEIGLLPRGYDLAQGLVEFLDEQAGGLYDPHTKVFLSIGDLPEALQSDPYQRLIAGHELTHALQDREHDLVAAGLEIIRDLDAGYALVAVIEGTAMVAGMAYMQGVSPRVMGDVGPLLRAGYETGNAGMEVFSMAPVYLQERLIGPYVDGATLVHAYLLNRPDSTMASLFRHPPASAEQVLHFDKYLDGDVPVAIDLSGVEGVRPDGWRPIYANTLGEFEIRTLCKSHPETRAAAAEIAAGWDGFRVAAWETGATPPLAVVGASAWDSEQDAEEFGEALATVLRTLHDGGGYEVRVSGDRVVFVTGVREAAFRRAILDRMAVQPEPAR